MDWLKKELVTRIMLAEQRVTEGTVDPSIVIAENVSSQGGRWRFGKNGLEMPSGAFHFVAHRRGRASYVIGANEAREPRFCIQRHFDGADSAPDDEGFFDGFREYFVLAENVCFKGDFVPNPSFRVRVYSDISLETFEVDRGHQIAAAALLVLSDSWIERLFASTVLRESWIHESMRDAVWQAHRSYAGQGFKSWTDPDEHLILADQMEESGDVEAGRLLRRSSQIATVVRRVELEKRRRRKRSAGPIR